MTTSNSPFKERKSCPTSDTGQKTAICQIPNTRADPPLPEAQKTLPKGVVYLTNRQVRKRYQIGNTTLYRWINDKQINFPKPHQLGPRCVRWLQSELEAWESL